MKVFQRNRGSYSSSTPLSSNSLFSTSFSVSPRRSRANRPSSLVERSNAFCPDE